MVRVSQRFSQISESQTVALTGVMTRMIRQGHDVVSLGAGEPDFDTPLPIKECAIESIREGHTKYTPADGSLELKDTICSWIKKEHNADYTPLEIIVTCGAKHAVFEAIMAVCDPGDEVLLPAPYWVSYPEQIKLAGAIPKIIPTDEKSNLKVTIQQLEKFLTPKTRLIILNTPGNPSGAVYEENEVKDIVRFVLKSGICILADEIYDKIIYDNLSFSSFARYKEIRDQLLFVNGVSKSFAMTGWRIGYLACHKDIASAVKKYQGHSTSNPSSISQKAAQAALEGDTRFIENNLKTFTERRDYVYNRLVSIDGVTCFYPKGAFYAFPNISTFISKSFNGKTIEGSADLCSILLEHFGVAIVPGSAFGMENHVRLSFAASMDTLKKALDRIEKGIKSLV